MSDPMYEEWVLRTYREAIAKQFHAQFSRPATSDDELIAYTLASFLLDTKHPANEILHVLAGYAAAIMRMWLPKDAELDKLKTLEHMIEAFAFIIQVVAKEQALIEEEKKLIEEELQKQNDVKAVERLTKRLSDLLLRKN